MVDESATTNEFGPPESVFESAPGSVQAIPGVAPFQLGSTQSRYVINPITLVSTVGAVWIVNSNDASIIVALFQKPMVDKSMPKRPRCLLPLAFKANSIVSELVSTSVGLSLLIEASVKPPEPSS